MQLVMFMGDVYIGLLHAYNEQMCQYVIYLGIYIIKLIVAF